jgi:glyoxylase-like metal-dependent hydrolase (beta-lactamase superfamily II)
LAPAPPPLRFGPFEVLPVQGTVSVIFGAGANILVQQGDDGVLLVDTGAAEHGQQVVALLKQLNPLPLRIVINSSADADHAGANAVVSRSGHYVGDRLDVGPEAAYAAIFAHENVGLRMAALPAGAAPLALGMLPTDPFFTPTLALWHNGESIQIIHVPAAHTDADSLVFFRHSDVLYAGELLDMNGYPVIDLQHGGSINGLIEGLNQVLDLALPRDKEEGGTLVVPGHGRLTDVADVSEYRDMVTIIRDRVSALKQRGLSLEQVQAKRPSYGYDARWAHGTPEQSAERFVAAIYASLPPTRKRAAR